MFTTNRSGKTANGSGSGSGSALRSYSTLLPVLTVACTLVSCTLAACKEDPKITADEVPVRVLTWNIGNPNAEDPAYPLRLKHQAYEDFVADRIAELSPDLVFFQEVLPETHCATMMETDPALTCYGAGEREPPIRRILGPGYTIACDARRHVECMGVRQGFGDVVGMAPGGYLIDFAETPPLPLEHCEWATGDCTNDLCDFESTVSALTVETPWGELRLVHAHPNAAGSGTAGLYTGAPCRLLQLRQIFEGLADPVPDPDNGNSSGVWPLVMADVPTIVAGDFNLDPIRMANADEKALWNAHVGAGKRFSDLNPVGEGGFQYGTRRGSAGVAIDHVLADASRTEGSCTVLGWDEGFGDDPGTEPLDEDFDWSLVPGGQSYEGRIDHFAILCDLVMDLRPTAR
jgi:endonuclease/exonuclease/phosphatase family metal-dependent hydrolase